ncbi:hypothetical protein JXA34_02760 [Patescibacteria group bacterium]|nr:hypothetical protein [Patescibacteria group bacterium]
MQVKVEKQPKSTVKLTVTIPLKDVKSAREEVIEEQAKTANIQGFRRGMAPKEIVEEKLGIEKIKGLVINKILKKGYTQALKENHIAAISNPKVEIKEFDINKDFEFTALVATRPDVKLKDYKKKLRKRYENKVEQTKKDLEKINKEKLAKGEKLAEAKAQLSTSDVLEILNEESEVEIPDLLIEEETDRMMSKLIDQTQNLGMSIEQYLRAQNKTADELREDYRQVAEKSIKAEFVLGHLTQEEKVDATDEEILETFKTAGLPDAKERLNNPLEKAYVKSILQKNKLLTKLMEEAEGEQKDEH